MLEKADPRVKIKESEKRDNYLDLTRKILKNGDGDINCCRCSWNDPQKLGKKTRRIGRIETI